MLDVREPRREIDVLGHCEPAEPRQQAVDADERPVPVFRDRSPERPVSVRACRPAPLSRVAVPVANQEVDEADVDPRNAPALRLVERLGFRKEGLLREHYQQHDEWQDGLLFGILEREWG